MIKIILSSALCTASAQTTKQTSRKLYGRGVANFNGGKCTLRKVTPDGLASAMLGNGQGYKNLPESMRGIWWHSYTTTVNTFLHNRPAQLKNGEIVSTVHVKNANSWSAKDTPLICGDGCKGTDEKGISDYKTNSAMNFAYTFKFSKLPDSREYDWAEIVPSPGGFSMGKESYSPQCGNYDAKNNPDAGKTSINPTSNSDLTLAQKRTRRCGHDEVWRRYTNPVGSVEKGTTKRPTLGFTYDVVKIVDEYGNKIQPNFDNWVSALEKKGRSYILLPEGDC